MPQSRDFGLAPLPGPEHRFLVLSALARHRRGRPTHSDARHQGSRCGADRVAYSATHQRWRLRPRASRTGRLTRPPASYCQTPACHSSRPCGGTGSWAHPLPRDARGAVSPDAVPASASWRPRYDATPARPRRRPCARWRARSAPPARSPPRRVARAFASRSHELAFPISCRSPWCSAAWNPRLASRDGAAALQTAEPGLSFHLPQDTMLRAQRAGCSGMQ
jgi:hypothetical protein